MTDRMAHLVSGDSLGVRRPATHGGGRRHTAAAGERHKAGRARTTLSGQLGYKVEGGWRESAGLGGRGTSADQSWPALRYAADYVMLRLICLAKTKLPKSAAL